VGHWKVYLTIKKGDKLIISSNNETDADAEKDMFLKNGVARTTITLLEPQ